MLHVLHHIGTSRDGVFNEFRCVNMLAQRSLYLAALLPGGRENNDEGAHVSCANGELAQSTKIGAAAFHVRACLHDAAACASVALHGIHAGRAWLTDIDS